MASTVEINQEGKALLITMKTPSARKKFVKEHEAKPPDLSIYFWDAGAHQALLLAGLSPKEIKTVKSGQTLSKRLEDDLLSLWVLDRKRRREKREKSISKIENLLDELHKLFRREHRMFINGVHSSDSDIMHSMDGSVRLWLQIIMFARLDFLTWCDSPSKWDEEDFVTAYGFLFDDEYTISIGTYKKPCTTCNPTSLIDPTIDYTREEPCPVCNGFLRSGGWIDTTEDDPEAILEPKEVTFREVFDTCVEICENRGYSIPPTEMSPENLRPRLAKASGDPELIAKHCK